MPTIQAYLSLQCLSSSLTSSEIMALIDPETISRIKATDPHPFFQAYSICHEGTSQPTILGDTARPIHWTRAAVQSIKKIVLKGVKFFKGHNEDNSTDKREALGEIVANSEREIDGKLHHIAIGYFPDKSKVSDSDICSQEANWNLFENAGKWFADTIEKMTGIALSNSKVDKPAFADARRLGMVQAFVLQAGGPGSGRRPEGGSSDDELHNNATNQEVADFIENKIKENEYSFYGVRIEDKKRNVGDVIEEESKSNDVRDDSRDFPDYGSEEYNSLEGMGGTSSWKVNPDNVYESLENTAGTNIENDGKFEGGFSYQYVYLIGGDNNVTSRNLDPGEIVIKNPKVIGIIRRGKSIQAFTADEGDKNNKAGDAKMDLSTVSFSELAGEMKRRNTFPHQLFTLDELKQDKQIIPIIDELDKLRKEITDKDKSLKDLEAEKTALSKKIDSVSAKDKIAKILDEDNLVKTTETQRKFIMERFKGLDDVTDEGIKKYIESEVKECKALIKILGVPEENMAGNVDTTPGDDATKAKNNPLLEEDFNPNI